MRNILTVLDSEPSLHFVEQLAEELDLWLRAIGPVLVVNNHADGRSVLDQDQGAYYIHVIAEHYLFHGTSVSLIWAQEPAGISPRRDARKRQALRRSLLWVEAGAQGVSWSYRSERRSISAVGRAFDMRRLDVPAAVMPHPFVG